MKWKSPKEFSRNTPKPREKVNEEHEHENTEIRIQTSSFIDSDSFYPALSDQLQPKTTKQSSRKYIGDFGTYTQDTTDNRETSQYSLAHQLKLRQNPKRQKCNFIEQNIRNISKYRNKKSKKAKGKPVLDDSKYAEIHNCSNSLRRKNANSRVLDYNRTAYQTHRATLEPKIELRSFDPRSIDSSSTFMINTQTPGHLEDKYLNILIHTTLDSSMSSDCELQLRCPDNEEISILEEYTENN